MKDSATSQKRILVVDDEEYVRKLLQRILEGAGYGVVTATSGQEALDKLADATINLVLLDVRMPGLNGYQTLELIRQRFTIPVIMVTGVGEATAAADAINLGADDYVRKPFNQRELLARIDAKLRRVKP
mgnify:CR=1 FL=1